MSHVVLQAAELRSVEHAARCEAELRALIDDYIRFEQSDPDPWGNTRVPPPLVSFGRRHRVDWPLDEPSRFLIKGLFADEARLLRVDRMVFFWAGGFHLGGPTLQDILRRLGARAIADETRCHVTIHASDPDARVDELVQLLVDEELDDQFSIDSDAEEIFSLTVVGPRHNRRLSFDDSGVQDWAFVSLLRQLSDADPALP